MTTIDISPAPDYRLSVRCFPTVAVVADRAAGPRFAYVGPEPAGTRPECEALARRFKARALGGAAFDPESARSARDWERIPAGAGEGES